MDPSILLDRGKIPKLTKLFIFIIDVDDEGSPPVTIFVVLVQKSEAVGPILSRFGFGCE